MRFHHWLPYIYLSLLHKPYKSLMISNMDIRYRYKYLESLNAFVVNHSADMSPLAFSARLNPSSPDHLTLFSRPSNDQLKPLRTHGYSVPPASERLHDLPSFHHSTSHQ
ncbi:hypothetical protein SMACR_00658 [Sordaria macrospora]|nr:hypothetical protein SMACR_00658 [Sordaria macrospora]WPJ66881.1 hypothetical protein SMAC4_00658 [Sordaria macrospora]